MSAITVFVSDRNMRVISIKCYCFTVYGEWNTVEISRLPHQDNILYIVYNIQFTMYIIALYSIVSNRIVHTV